MANTIRIKATEATPGVAGTTAAGQAHQQPWLTLNWRLTNKRMFFITELVLVAQAVVLHQSLPLLVMVHSLT